MTGEPNPSRDGNQAARSHALEFFVLLALGVMLLASNSRVTFIDDEASFLNGAAAPVSQTFHTIWNSSVPIDHPALGDIVLHCWLSLTGRAFDWLRVPSILFNLAGVFFLSRAAKKLGADDAARIVVWLGALWPYGFHYGRMATDSPLCFLLIAGLTLAYLWFVEQPGIGRWCFALLVAIALVWTSYFGWAVIACLSFDYTGRERGNLRRVAGPFSATALILAAAY